MLRNIFLIQGFEQAQLGDDDSEQLTRWFNSQFQHFASTLYSDIQMHRSPPLHVVAHHCFDVASSRYADLLLKLHSSRAMKASASIRAEVASQVQAALQLAKPTFGDKRANGSHGQSNYGGRQTPFAAPVSMPRTVERAIPRKDGIPCCLRSLTVKGCHSNVSNGRCGHGSLQKSHFVPTSLPPAVKTWMTQDKKWTLKSDFGGKSEPKNI